MDKCLENILNQANKIIIDIDNEKLTDLEKITALKSAAGILENYVQMKGMALMFNKAFDNMDGKK